MWPERARAPRILSREINPGDPFSSMHAKVFLADESTALVTSANLTAHGLHRNIEIGILVRSPAVGRLAEALLALEGSEEFVVLRWGPKATRFSTE